MVLTVDLDQDVYDFISAYADGRGITFSAAVNELVRRAQQAPEPETGSKLVRSEHGYLVVAATGHVLTSEMVKEYSEDELLPRGRKDS